MAQINFTPLIERTIEDREFGSRLVAFAKAHGIDLLAKEEMSEDELDDVAGGLTVDEYAIRTYKLDYKIQPLSIDLTDSFISGGGGAGKVS